VAEQQNAVAVVPLVGQHDLTTADELRRSLAEAADRGQPAVVDLSDLIFLDSTIVGVLLAARERSEEAGLGFALVIPGEGEHVAYRVLGVTGLLGVFAIYPTVEAALASIAHAPRGGTAAGAAAEG
jgi:anti-anti-sigma factor